MRPRLAHEVRTGRFSDARLCSVSARDGQNHAIIAIAIGIEPQTTAQGVKIDAMNIRVVATADTNGQIVGAGKRAR